MMQCSVPKYKDGTVQGYQMKALIVPSKLIEDSLNSTPLFLNHFVF